MFDTEYSSNSTWHFTTRHTSITCLACRSHIPTYCRHLLSFSSP